MRRAAWLMAALLLCSCSGRFDEVPPNQKPMFGGLQRGSVEIVEDVKEADGALKAAGGDSKKASSILSAQAWQYEKRGYWDIAMVRFNQAWLLDPTNVDAVPGMADSLMSQGRFDESAALFEEIPEWPAAGVMRLALLSRRFQDKSAELHGRWWSGRREARSYLDLALKLYALAARSSKDDTELDQIYYQWAIALAIKRDYAGAWEKIRESQRHGGKSIEPAFLERLAKDYPVPVAA